MSPRVEGVVQHFIFNFLYTFVLNLFFQHDHPNT